MDVLLGSEFGRTTNFSTKNCRWAKDADGTLGSNGPQESNSRARHVLYFAVVLRLAAQAGHCLCLLYKLGGSQPSP